ncbi:hypothetical protein [uncultured Parabacteroides sp.]|uniref:hypothetical protein n=1 Tax=uncultured Parabacteroides sp. TaxID=512312 RepID=UPI002625449B|nr:hypothetical protein [uncultured Parabacteroides sp.]
MFTTELVSLKNKILLPPGAGEAGFACSYRRREPAEPDSHAAGSAESRRRQIHMQPALPGASGGRFTCSRLCREPAGPDSRAAIFAGSRRGWLHMRCLLPGASLNPP